MADSSLPAAAGTAKAADESANAKDTALDQPTDAVKMTPIDTSKPAEASGSANPEANKADPAEGSSKGKEAAIPDDAAEVKGKHPAEDQEQAENTALPASDSLSINPAPSPDGATLAKTESAQRTCHITLLLSTGARHPYKINERYLSRREVDIPEQHEGKPDPFSISVYKLKELILREWRDEWEGKPRDPSLIRLIYMGKLLDDKEPLKKYRFNETQPNIIHITVRPAEMVEEDEAAKGAGGNKARGDYPRSGCCCVIL